MRATRAAAAGRRSPLAVNGVRGAKRCAVALLTLICLLGASSIGAQQAPQRFRAAVNTVRVDAVVTDDAGNFVDDLRPEEFRLFEDGAEQEIVTIELVDLAERRVRRVAAAGAAGVPRAEPAGAEVPGPDAGSPTSESATDLGAIIFFIDLPGLYFRNSADFADSMLRLFERAGQLDLPYAIYLVDMAGRLRELQPLTTDLDALRGAAREARATTSPVFIRDYLFGALDAGSGGAYRADRGEARSRTIYTYGLLRDFVESLAHRAGRTALVWVSTGVDLAAYESMERPYALLGQGNPTPGIESRNYSPDLGVLDLQQQLHRSANSVNVSIYSVDPTTLADFYVTTGGLKTRIGKTEDARGSSLRNAAHATGGDVFIGWTELDRVLETIERDTGRFYLLSYVPPAAGEGLYHEIRVDVSRPDVDIRARRGYTRYSERDRLSRTVRSALDLPGTVSGFDIAVQSVRARLPDGKSVLVVDSAVPVADGRPLLVFSTVRNADAELVATVENQRLTPPPVVLASDPAAAPTRAGEPAATVTPAGASVATPAVDGSAPGPAYWTHRAAHRLPPGEYDVSVTILDPASERVGAARIEVEIGEPGAWDTSDPWLVSEAADGTTVPVIDGRVAEGRRVFMYIEVYGGVSPEVGGNVLPASGDRPPGATVGEITELDAAASQPGPSLPLAAVDGIHRASVPLMALPAGIYVLDFDIRDPGAGRARTVRLPLQVVEAQQP